MSPKPRTALEIHRSRMPVSERKLEQTKALTLLASPKHKELKEDDLEPEKK